MFKTILYAVYGLIIGGCVGYLVYRFFITPFREQRNKLALFEALGNVDQGVVKRLQRIQKFQRILGDVLDMQVKNYPYEPKHVYDAAVRELRALISNLEGRKLPAAPVTNPVDELLEEYDGGKNGG